MAGHRTELAAYDAMVGLARRLSMDTAPVSASIRPAPIHAGPTDGRPVDRARARGAIGAGGVSTVA
jgi:hypothetical protein